MRVDVTVGGFGRGAGGDIVMMERLRRGTLSVWGVEEDGMWGLMTPGRSNSSSNYPNDLIISLGIIDFRPRQQAASNATESLRKSYRWPRKQLLSREP